MPPRRGAPQRRRLLGARTDLERPSRDGGKGLTLGRLAAGARVTSGLNGPRPAWSRVVTSGGPGGGGPRPPPGCPAARPPPAVGRGVRREGGHQVLDGSGRSAEGPLAG